MTLAAERSSFYLIDRENEELVADIFEKGIEESEGILRINKVKLIGKEKEIVASVAKTGIPVNIKDAFTDPKIGKEIDSKTGFIVRSILCIAVKGESEILGKFKRYMPFIYSHTFLEGVMEVVNKKNGCFTKSDEILFQVFATYFALVLQFSYLHQKVKRQVSLSDIVHQVNPYNQFIGENERYYYFLTE